jgi:general secretion pathway protein L
MPDRLLLRLAPDGELTWLRQVDGSRTSASALGRPPAGAVAAADEIVVLVPAEDVLLTEASLSARNRMQLMQALPYAVEEQLLGSVEDLHFAASRDNAGTVGVAVVAKAKMRAWLDMLGAAGIRPDVLLPDSLAVPTTAEQANVLIEDARVVARLAPWSAFACSPRELPGWIALVQPKTIAVRDFRAAPALALPQKPAVYLERQRDPLAFIASVFTQAPLNLLDGEFALQHRHARGKRWWRVAALLAAAVVVLAVAGLGADVLRLSRQSARMDKLAQEAVQKAFPDIDASQLARLSPEQLMRSRLDHQHGGAESGGLLRVLTQIAPVLAKATRVQTRGMEYRNGTFELSLRAPDMTMLDLVREQVAMLPGLKVELTAANPGPDGVDGRIRIDAGDARGGTP